MHFVSVKYLTYYTVREHVVNFIMSSPPLWKLDLLEGMLVPRYVTVLAGLKWPVLPELRTPFHTAGLSATGLGKVNMTS